MMNLFSTKTPSPPWVVAIVGWVARFVSMGTSFWVLRMNLEAFGPQRFAVLALLLGLAAWFALADVGLGTWLQNAISRGRAQNKDTVEIARQTITVVFTFMGALSLAAWLSAPIMSKWLLGSFDFIPHDERVLLWRITVILQLGVALGQIYGKVLFALMRGVSAHMLTIAINLITTAAVMLVLQCKPASLSLIIIASLLPGGLMASVTWAFYLRGRFGWPQTPDLLSALRGGFSFFRFFAMGTITLNCDLIIAARHLAPSEMASYLVGLRLFNVMLVLYGSVMAALWPHCSEAYALQNYARVKKLLKQMLLVGGSGVVGFTLMIALGASSVSQLLSPREVLVLPLSLLLTMGAALLVRVWCDAHALILQSCDRVAPLFYHNLAQAAISVVLQVWFVKLWGVIGLPLGICLSFLLTVAWALPALVDRMLNAKTVVV